jgi:hypothetical protein
LIRADNAHQAQTAQIIFACREYCGGIRQEHARVHILVKAIVFLIA